jgi:hypothetical protein
MWWIVRYAMDGSRRAARAKQSFGWPTVATAKWPVKPRLARCGGFPCGLCLPPAAQEETTQAASPGRDYHEVVIATDAVQVVSSHALYQ